MSIIRSMTTDYRIATKAVYANGGFVVDCWILSATDGEGTATIMEITATDADNELEAEYYGLVSTLSTVIQCCGDDVGQQTLEIVPQHEDIGHQLLNREAIDSVSVYHLRAKVLELMSRLKSVSIGLKEQ